MGNLISQALQYGTGSGGPGPGATVHQPPGVPLHLPGASRKARMGDIERSPDVTRLELRFAPDIQYSIAALRIQLQHLRYVYLVDPLGVGRHQNAL